MAQNPNAFSLSRVLLVSSKSTINHYARTNHAIFISTVAERWGDFCVMLTKHSKSAWSAPFTVERFWSGPVVRSKRFHAARTFLDFWNPWDCNSFLRALAIRSLPKIKTVVIVCMKQMFFDIFTWFHLDLFFSTRQSKKSRTIQQYKL